jgi:hypothetical protein
MVAEDVIPCARIMEDEQRTDVACARMASLRAFLTALSPELV